METLTWQEAKKIVEISDAMIDEDVRGEVLRRFNEKNK